MRNIILFIVLGLSINAFAQTNMNIHKTDGSVVSIALSEIDSVTYSSAVIPPPVEGDGSFENPFEIAQVLANPEGTGVWVRGFLVGVIETGGSSNVSSFTPPFNTHTNVYIASTPEETDSTQMLIVQLPNNQVRTETNLEENGSLVGMEIKYYGNIEPYFSLTGLKGTTGYWLIESNTGIDPEAPVEVNINGTSEIVTFLNESFDNGTAGTPWALNGWLTANILGERNFEYKTYDGNNYVQTSGYQADATDLEMWLVTPGINCDVNKQFSFESKMGYWKHNALSVYISTDFDGNNANLTTATWTDITSEFTIPTEPASGYGSTYTPSGNYDMSSYTGQTVYFLFKYTGNNSTNTTTVQIDNVMVLDL